MCFIFATTALTSPTFFNSIVGDKSIDKLEILERISHLQLSKNSTWKISRGAICQLITYTVKIISHLPTSNDCYLFNMVNRTIVFATGRLILFFSFKVKKKFSGKKESVFLAKQAFFHYLIHSAKLLGQRLKIE